MEQLRDGGLSAKTIGVHLAAILFASKARSLPDPSRSFLARQAPDGCRLVTMLILQTLIVHLRVICSSRYELLLSQASFSLTFFGAFRSCEFLSSSRSYFSGRSLLLSDVSLTKGVLQVHLCRSKSD